MKKLYLIILLFLLPLVSSVEITLNDYEIGDNVTLIQVCNCTYNNISAIMYGDQIIVKNLVMTRDGTFFNYSLSNNYTMRPGRYIVNGYGDRDGLLDPWSYDFYVTKIGERREINPYVPLVPILFFGIICLIMAFRIDNFVGKNALFAFTLLSIFVSVQYTIIILEGYSLVADISSASYLLLLFQVIGWVIGGLFILVIVYLVYQLRKLAQIRKGLRDE